RPSELSRLTRRHDVLAMRVADPREERLPSRGLVRIVDLETGEPMEIDLSGADASGQAGMRDQELRREMVRAGVDSLTLSTAFPYEREIIQFFSRRSTQRGRRR
ncbi:MAG: DUF58 domain-containing protein, partial [Acidobacteria bacterium]|nr:DUF58 domain-containing protein [Acidobacteriota bacterium]